MKKIKYEKRNIFPYNMFEDRCGCGANIPMGYGYYNCNKPLRCFNCGRMNKKLIVGLPKEEHGWLTKAIVDKIKNYDKRKKEKERELLRLDIEIEQLKKKLERIKK
jgi:hypothetical protein